MFFWIIASSHCQLLLLAFLDVLRFCLFCLWCDLRLNNKRDLYFRPFGSCAEVLTPGTVEKYFLPVIVSCFCFSFIIFYFSEIVQDTKSDGLQKHTQTRNSTLMGKVCCMEKDSNLNLWKWIKNKIYIVGVRFSIKGTFVKLVLKHSFLLVFQDFVPKFLESLTDDELKKEAKNEVKNDALSSIIKVQSFKCYCNCHFFISHALCNIAITNDLLVSKRTKAKQDVLARILSLVVSKGSLRPRNWIVEGKWFPNLLLKKLFKTAVLKLRCWKKITFSWIAWENSKHCMNTTTTSFPTKWLLRNERRNSMTFLWFECG